MIVSFGIKRLQSDLVIKGEKVSLEELEEGTVGFEKISIEELEEEDLDRGDRGGDRRLRGSSSLRSSRRRLWASRTMSSHLTLMHVEAGRDLNDLLVTVDVIELFEAAKRWL